MNTILRCDARHVLPRAAALILACAILAAGGCSSASSGHAPGVAGGETLTPGITNFPIAYVKRPVPKTDIDVRDLITSTTGGDLYVRDQASAAGAETNVTRSITQGMGDVRDLDVSPDGTKVVFSLRLPLLKNLANTDPKQPTWKIYQYDAATKIVTQLTNDDITSGHDVGAHYLPDGRIVFASTRQLATQSILLNEGRPQYQAVTDNRQQAIFLLHVMNADGTGMHQISFNTNHDFAPSVLASGQIVFSRWEVTNGADRISLYRCNPDGSGLALYYGANSHATGANIAGTNDNVVQFLSARERADGRLIAIDRPFLGTQQGGDTLLIDAQHFVENRQSASPGAAPAGPGQVSATPLGVTTDAGLPSQGGRFYSAYPLYDGTNRMLVSWSPCLVLDSSVTPPGATVCTSANSSGATVQVAPPQYTVWLYDFGSGSLAPLLAAEAGTMIVEPVILQKRSPAPTFIADFKPANAASQNLVNATVGILDIASVYDVDGVDTANPSIVKVSDPADAAFYARPYRFIRIEKAVEIPSEKVRKIDASAFGPAGMGMREILGYAPIQPDGSVQIQVPANVPFTIDILDLNARRITARHTSWLQLLPGETKACNGCHGTANGTSHGRPGLTAPANLGAPTTSLPFPGTNPNLFANAGETMAQTLARISCATGSVLTCSQVLSTDVLYAPIWTYTYAGNATTAGLSQPPPTNANCAPWSAECRITIHYANAASANMMQYAIQSVWNLSPRTAPVGGASVVCVTCHNPKSAAGPAQLPPDSLDLTGGVSSVVTSVVTSYEQLLFPRDEQTLNMGVLLNTVPEPGPPDPVTGLPTTIMATVLLPPPMSAGSAAGSTGFFGVFDTGGSHYGWLTPAELRLISEWLDIGGQFYNDPFVAPVAN
jgi:hypothetical protein